MRLPLRSQHPRQAQEAIVLSSPVLGPNEELRSTVLMDVVESRLLDDADDRQPMNSVHIRAERVASREKLFRKVLIDQSFTVIILPPMAERATGADHSPITSTYPARVPMTSTSGASRS